MDALAALVERTFVFQEGQVTPPAERRVLEFCPSCFSTSREVRGYAPNLGVVPMAGPQDWPLCRDDHWHLDGHDGLKTCFDSADLPLLAASFSGED